MPDDEGLREELAAALCLAEHAEMQRSLIPVFDTDDPRNEVAACYVCQRKADALLSLVERYAARRAAETLREAENAYGRDKPNFTAWLRARADALAADGTEPHPAHRHDETEAGR